MKVQRIRHPETNEASWIVLDDVYLPIEPITAYLAFLESLGRSPHTRRAIAHHLKLFWEFLRDEQASWTELDIARLASFISWLRRPAAAMLSIAPQEAKRTNATIDQMLASVHGLDVKRDYLWYTTRTDDLIKERHDFAGDQLGLLSPRTREPDHAGLHRTAGS